MLNIYTYARCLSCGDPGISVFSPDGKKWWCSPHFISRPGSKPSSPGSAWCIASLQRLDPGAEYELLIARNQIPHPSKLLPPLLAMAAGAGVPAATVLLDPELPGHGFRSEG
jgi:hypothetical protein